MKIEVASLWYAGDQCFEGGVYELDSPTDELLSYIAAGENVGIVTVLDATKAQTKTLDSAIQSQEDGEKALAAAVADGSWETANLVQFLLDVPSRLAPLGALDPYRGFLLAGAVDAAARLDRDEEAASWQADLDAFRTALAAAEPTSSGEDA